MTVLSTDINVDILDFGEDQIAFYEINPSH